MIAQEKHQYGGSVRGRRFCIVGGGIGGLTAALALSHFGAGEVEVYEQAEAFGEVGAGIQITPNGGRVLDALGLAARLDERAVVSKAVMPMNAISGRQVTRFDLTGYQDPPYRFIHRADLIGILADACDVAGVGLNLGSKVEARDLDADVVIGAEGIHSPSRVDLNGTSEPFFTGQVAWRAIVDAPDAEAVARIWMAPRRHIVTYPLRAGRMNIVAVQERQQWAGEGWQTLDDAGNLRQAFRDVCAPLKGLLGAVEEVHLWGLFRHPVAERWTRAGADGNLAILGDAAHPTLPFLAQGANLAIEDAFVLARCLSEAEDTAQAFRNYENLRKDRVGRAIDAANANARNYHLSGFARTVAHTGLKTLGFVAPNAFLGRMDWLYGLDVTD